MVYDPVPSVVPLPENVAPSAVVPAARTSTARTGCVGLYGLPGADPRVTLPVIDRALRLQQEGVRQPVGAVDVPADDVAVVVDIERLTAEMPRGEQWAEIGDLSGAPHRRSLGADRRVADDGLVCVHRPRDDALAQVDGGGAVGGSHVQVGRQVHDRVAHDGAVGGHRACVVDQGVPARNAEEGFVEFDGCAAGGRRGTTACCSAR